MTQLRRLLSAALAASLSVVALGVVVPAAQADTGPAIRITEIAYGGKAVGTAVADTDGEYVELTNVGDAAQDLAGGSTRPGRRRRPGQVCRWRDWERWRPVSR